ncbi:MAG: MaoC family dehydratase [Candidatus Thorarchaeota archaeon]
MKMKLWDDFQLDQSVKTWSITVTETHIVNWAGLTMDYYPLHMDEEYAKNTRFKGRIAHGPLLLSLAIGLVGSSGFLGNAALAWLGLENLRIPLPTRAGDTITVHARVLEKRETKDKEKGIVILEYKVLNQQEETVMSFNNVILYPRRSNT